MSTVEKGVRSLGIIFIILGLWGFFQNPILGIFLVGTANNWAYLLSGVLAIAFATRGSSSARQFAKIFGVIFGVFALVGFFTPTGPYFGTLWSNTATDVLHLIFSVVFLYLGYGRTYEARRRMHEAPARG